MCGSVVGRVLIDITALVKCSLVHGISELLNHSLNISRLQSSTLPLSSLSILSSVECSIPKNRPRFIQLLIVLKAIINAAK